jgi:hypothetical protein
MSGSDHDGHLRLVPLMEAAPDTGKRNQILTLAANGKIILFVQVKPGQVAYADQPSWIAPDPASHRVRRTISLQTQNTIDRDRRRGVPVIVFPEPHREVAFFALEPMHAQSLLAAQSVHTQWFPSGLKLERGFLEPVAFPSKLCLRPSGDVGAPGPWRDGSSEHTFKIELRDVLLDDRVPSRVEELVKSLTPKTVARIEAKPESTGQVLTPRWSGLADTKSSFDIPEGDELLLSPVVETGDPYGLRERAPGVFVLYAAARHFYEKPRVTDVVRKDVVEWLQSDDWKTFSKLFNKTNAPLVFKFINPSYNPLKGRNENWMAKPFPSEILARASQKYQQYPYSSYISDYLAIIVHAADEFHASDQWKKLIAQSNSDEAKLAKQKLDKIERFKKVLHDDWGFLGKAELGAVVDIVIWPTRIVDLNEARRNRGSH